MPIYTYRCPRCDVTKDEVRKYAERDAEPLPECVECHQPMQRAPTAPSGTFPGAASWRS